MGNAIFPCFHQISNSSVKLIFFQGTTKMLIGRKHIAGEIMFDFPDQIVCHADSFFIGHPVPALAIHDQLMSGQTYFVLPIQRFAFNVLSPSFLAALSSCQKQKHINFPECPFEYVKGADGRVLVKVVPEFITRLITGGRENINGGCECDTDTDTPSLCSTPELKKHYKLLVGSKEQLWSPKLETISEYI